MIESKSNFVGISPRSGLAENSPALQCWVKGRSNQFEPVKRASDVMTDDKLRSYDLSSAQRTGEEKMRRTPSDESLGYFHSSASRTVMLVIAVSLFLATSFTSSGQTPAASATPDDVKVPAVAVDYRA